MKRNILILIQVCLVCFLATSIKAEVFLVASQEEFDDAHDDASMNDSIVWKAGNYMDIYMDLSKDHLFVLAETPGNTIFTGESMVDISGDHITFEGFQFLEGNIGTEHIINITGSHIHFTQVNIQDYTSYKYLRVKEESQYVSITYCNFENRLNLDDQNILSILVDDNQPGYHKIQYCSFKNFDGIGNDMGMEPIRVGVSTQSEYISRTLVEYCYFTQCNGDGEIISSKARQNVYRFNTFEDNPKAELVLRHGSEGIVYGNFFLNGKGGVRIREGQNHYIYNNYFYDLFDRPIYIQNEPDDPLDNINIAFNTVVKCAEIRLGGDGAYKPTNVTFSNNILTDPDDDLFEDRTGTETWIGNMANGSLGMTFPATGMDIIDPLLELNSEGFWGLSEGSPAINAAQPGYAPLPQFEEMDTIDSEILFDLMGQVRPPADSIKDLGCSEHPHHVLIRPIATEENTGPAYLDSIITGLEQGILIVKDLIDVFPNPVTSQIQLTLKSEFRATIWIDVLNLEGKKVETIFKESNFSGQKIISKQLDDLPSGIYTIVANSLDKQAGIKRTQTIKIIKD